MRAATAPSLSIHSALVPFLFERPAGTKNLLLSVAKKKKKVISAGWWQNPVLPSILQRCPLVTEQVGLCLEDNGNGKGGTVAVHRSNEGAVPPPSSVLGL